MAKAPSNKITAGDIQDLAVAVEQLTEETRLLRMSLDELRDDVIWAARQVLATGYQAAGTSPPAPRDPLAPDATISKQNAVFPSASIDDGGDDGSLRRQAKLFG